MQETSALNRLEALAQREGNALVVGVAVGETREVVDAVMQAQQTLQTAIAIRDKVVTAFLDVTRMQM